MVCPKAPYIAPVPQSGIVSCLYNWLLLANAIIYSRLSQLIALHNLTNPTWSCEQDLWHLMIGNASSFCQNSSTKFVDEKLTIESLQMLNCSMLKELGVTLMGEALCILQQAKEDCTELWPALFLSASWTLFGGMCYCYSTIICIDKILIGAATLGQSQPESWNWTWHFLRLTMTLF